jgi:hypothetical protein
MSRRKSLPEKRAAPKQLEQNSILPPAESQIGEGVNGAIGQSELDAIRHSEATSPVQVNAPEINTLEDAKPENTDPEDEDPDAESTDPEITDPLNTPVDERA